MLIPESVPESLIAQTTFYLSGSLPCPYLAGQVERKLFTHLDGDKVANAALNGLLTQAGFRRSHDVVYRPACPTCHACIPARVPVVRFVPTRTQRRCWQRNQSLRVTLEEPVPTAEQFALFQIYQQSRHAESDMAQMTEAAYRDMVREGSSALQFLMVRDADHVLQGVLLTDRLPDGFSAIYSFFNPANPALGLGTLLVLQLIAAARAENLPYVYLGYWIAQSDKMAYKANFQPQERLAEQGWTL